MKVRVLPGSQSAIKAHQKPLKALILSGFFILNREIFNFLDCFNVIEYKQMDQDPKATLSISFQVPLDVVLDDDYKKNYNPRIRKLYKLLEGF